jgi:glycosyltransferase involved in cell wall biosynthesis
MKDNHKAKILLVANRHKPAIGGSEYTQQTVIDILTDLGYDVDIVTTNLKYSHGNKRVEAKKFEKEQNYNIYRFNGFRLIRDPFIISPGMYFWLIKNANKYDYIYAFTYGYHTSFIPAFLKWIGIIKRPIIFEPHYGPNKSLPSFIVKIFDSTLGSFTAKHVNKTILLTPKYKEFFKKLGAKDINVIRPVVTHIPKKDENEINGLLEKYNIPKNKKYLLSLGRVVEYKGIQYALEGLKTLKNNDPELYNSVHFIVAGDGEYLEELKNISKRLDIKSKVTFTGRVSDEDRSILYNLSNVFIFLSYSGESFGLVLIEAMSVGTPAIATREGAVDAVVDNNKDGILIDYKNQIEFCNALKRILGRDSREFTKNALEKAANYKRENVKEEFRKFFNSFSSPDPK